MARRRDGSRRAASEIRPQHDLRPRACASSSRRSDPAQANGAGLLSARPASLLDVL
jgi:hypothetical protein